MGWLGLGDATGESIRRLPAESRLELLAIREQQDLLVSQVALLSFHHAPVLVVDRQLEDAAVGELLVAEGIGGDVVPRARETVAEVAPGTGDGRREL